MKKLLHPPVKRIRERRRANGSVRIWWEPEKAVQDLGFTSVELDEQRLTWSRRTAERLNADVDQARATGERMPATRGHTMRALIEEYRRDRRFTERKPATRKSYLANMALIERKWGADPVSEFTDAVMERWYNTLYQQSGPRQAEALIGMCRILFKLAERIGWRRKGSNPCENMDITTPPPRQRIASWPEIDAMVTAADRLGHPAVGTAVLLSLYQGQRQTDVLAARRDDVQLRDVCDPVTGASARIWVWCLVRSKRQTEGGMQLHPDLVPRISETLARLDAAAPHLLVDAVTGRRFTVDLFQKRFAMIRAAAGRDVPSVATLTFRDLRRTFGILARAGGATKDDTGDVLGNSAAVNPRLGDTYMPPQFWTASRAVMAITKPKDERKKA